MKRFELFFAVLKVPVDLGMHFLAAVAAYVLRFTAWAVAMRPVLFDMSLGAFLERIVFVLLGWLVLFAFSGLYTTDPNRKLSQDVGRVALACSTGLAGVAIFVMFSGDQFDSRFLVAAGWACAVVCVSIGRIAVHGIRAWCYRAGMGLRRVAVVGHGAVADRVVETLSQTRTRGSLLVGQYSQFDGDAARALEQTRPDELIFVNPKANEEETLSAVDFCFERHIMFRYSADLFATYATNMTVQPVAGIPVVSLKRTRLDGWGRIWKRAYDVAVGSVMLVLFFPFMCVIAIAVVAETGRPFLYKNKRVGLFGQPFWTFKFRTMYQEYCTGDTPDAALEFEQELLKTHNTKEPGPVYKIGDDPRVTRVGKFLRRWSLDELPQFWNVWKGEMSVVGPRPHQPREVAQYAKHHTYVLHIRPGMTGLSQISGRSDLSFEEEVRLDVLYMERWNPLLDGIISLKTPCIVFKKRKAL